MKKILVFVMCLCCSMMFFACGQDNSDATGTGDSSQIEQDSSDILDDSSDGSSDDSSSDSSGDGSDDSSNEGDKGVWTPPAKQ